MISSEVTLGNAFSDVPVEVSKYKIIIQYLELCGKLSTGQMICFKNILIQDSARFCAVINALWYEVIINLSFQWQEH